MPAHWRPVWAIGEGRPLPRIGSDFTDRPVRLPTSSAGTISAVESSPRLRPSHRGRRGDHDRMRGGRRTPPPGPAVSGRSSRSEQDARPGRLALGRASASDLEQTPPGPARERSRGRASRRIATYRRHTHRGRPGNRGRGGWPSAGRRGSRRRRTRRRATRRSPDPGNARDPPVPASVRARGAGPAASGPTGDGRGGRGPGGCRRRRANTQGVERGDGIPPIARGQVGRIGAEQSLDLGGATSSSPSSDGDDVAAEEDAGPESRSRR